RILGQLFGISYGDPKSNIYLDVLSQQTKLSSKEIRIRANEALHLLLHDYNHFRIETIDSFFQSVMRSLARELGLTPNLNIELDSSSVLEETTAALLEGLEENSKELQWIKESINENIDNESGWDVSGSIEKIGSQLFNEEFVINNKGLIDAIKENPNVVDEYRKMLKELIKECDQMMKTQAENLLNLLQTQYDLSVSDFSYGTRGAIAYFTKLIEGNYTDEEKLLSTRFVEARDDPEKWSTKTNPKKGIIIDAASQQIIPLINRLENEQKTGERNLASLVRTTAEISSGQLSQLRLLEALREMLINLNHQENRFLLSETNSMLHRLIGKDDASFVFEKQGVQIEHIMIDEFQDTSTLQWRNFKLLLLEGLSKGGDSLIVGDVKQSIYRWRGGDWSILNDLGTNKTETFFPVKVLSLITNRRSQTRIINFNNSLFDYAVQAINAKHKEQFDEPCDALIAAYKDVKQEAPAKPEAGYIQIHQLTNRKNAQRYREDTIYAMVEQVKVLIEKGVNINDIAILIEKNFLIVDIARIFEEEMHLTVISDDAFMLKASPVIVILINSLRYLVDNQNKVALTQLIIDLRKVKINTPSESLLDTEVMTSSLEVLTNNLDRYVPPILRDNYDDLKQLPLYNLLEELYDALDLKKIEGQEAYLFSFFDQVMQYLEKNNGDLSLFIKYWDDKLIDKCIPSSELDGIRVTTIHKSKGLEFHTVLLPFVDWDLNGNENFENIHWCKPQKDSPFGWDMLPLVPINFQRKTVLNSIYKQEYLKEKLQQWVDAINKLYVACTRAESNLFIWHEKSKYTTKGILSNGTQMGVIIEDAITAIDLEKEIPFRKREVDCRTVSEEEPPEDLKDGKPIEEFKESKDEDETEEPDTIIEYGEIALSKQLETKDKSATEESQESKTIKNRFMQKPSPVVVSMHSSTPIISFRQSNRSAQFMN
ncbi:MAG: UvrD-helicase domain-containing protein, partial [Bacteroidaceae bacterium]